MTRISTIKKPVWFREAMAKTCMKKALENIESKQKSGLHHKQSVIMAFFRVNGIPEPQFEVNVIESRRFRWDIAWPESMLAIEIEGGIWTKGGSGHSHPTGIIRDMEKHNLATLAGWRCLRVVPEKLLKQETVEMVKGMLK